MGKTRTGIERGGAGGPEVRPAALAFGVLGGMIAWTIHLTASYAVVPLVCGAGHGWLLHVLTGSTALVSAAALAVAWRARRRTRSDSPEGDPRRDFREEGPGPEPPEGPEPAAAPWRETRVTGFLALSGMLLSGFFLFLILVEGLPVLVQQDPCVETPTLDSPIIHADPGATPALAALVHGRSLVGPDGLWTAWNPNPWLLSATYILTALYATGVRRLWTVAGRGRGIPTWRAGAYFGGIAALLLALVSPVDAIGGELFSVHMVQHMLLMVVAAPLLVLGRPTLACLWALPDGTRRSVGLWFRRFPLSRWGWAVIGHPVTVLIVHVGALWLWHVPVLYEAALARPAVHHLEHASFFLTAMLFWWALAEAGTRGRWPGYGAGILYVFATALQSGALGALLLFAPDPWYPAHQPGATAWGIDLLTDQQLAGAIMWIPAGLVYAGAGVALFLAWMKRADEAASRRERAGWSTLRPGHR